MIKKYLNQNINFKNFIDIYHVPGFLKFLMVIVSVSVFEYIIIE